MTTKLHFEKEGFLGTTEIVEIKEEHHVCSHDPNLGSLMVITVKMPDNILSHYHLLTTEAQLLSDTLIEDHIRSCIRHIQEEYKRRSHV